MDFIFLALLLQLLILGVLIIFSFDLNQFAKNSKMTFKLGHLKLIQNILLKRIGLFREIPQPANQSETAALPPAHFLDCEVKTIPENDEIGKEPGTSIELQSPQISVSEQKSKFKSYTCRFFGLISTKTVKIYKSFKTLYSKIEKLARHNEAQTFDFSQPDLAYEAKSPSRNYSMMNSPLHQAIQKARAEPMMSPFRSYDSSFLLKRKIKRKILKIEMEKLRNGGGKALSPINELPELENGSGSNMDE